LEFLFLIQKNILGLTAIRSDDMLRIPKMSTMMPVTKYNVLTISFERKIQAILLVKMDRPHGIVLQK